MKLPSLSFLALLLTALIWSGCGEGGSTENAETDAPEEPSLATLPASGRSLQWKDLPVLSPESIIGDGEFYYVSNVGKELKPSEKDGDGFIMKLNGEGEVIAEKFIEGLDAPKGSAIINGIFYVADIDKVRGYDLATGDSSTLIDFSSTGSQFLNDLVPMGDNLLVSATDINRIYQINLADGSFSELETKPTVQGPNGLWYNAAKKELIVATYPPEPKGLLYGIDMSTKVDGAYSAKAKATYEGTLDGLAVIGDYAFVSDWNRQTVVIVNTATGQVSGSGLSAQVQGPADFFLDTKRGEIWLPGMVENSISIQSLPQTN